MHNYGVFLIIFLLHIIIQKGDILLAHVGVDKMMKFSEEMNMLLLSDVKMTQQELARKIGEKNMSKYLNEIEYGNMKVDSINIDSFWLKGESRINQFQQIDFLKRFYYSELPISKRTEMIMKRMMIIEQNGRFKLSGKTGWSIRNGNNNGWFVGYIETQNKTYFFASNVEPKKQFDMDMFPMIRKDVTLKVFEQMKLIN